MCWKFRHTKYAQIIQVNRSAFPCYKFPRKWTPHKCTSVKNCFFLIWSSNFGQEKYLCCINMNRSPIQSLQMEIWTHFVLLSPELNHVRFLVHTDYSKRIHMHTHRGTHTHEHSDDYHYYYHFNSLEKTRCQAVRHAQVVQLLCTTFRQLDQQWGLLLGIFIQCSIGLLKDT